MIFYRSARKLTVKGKLEYNLLSSHNGNDWKSDKGGLLHLFKLFISYQCIINVFAY